MLHSVEPIKSIDTTTVRKQTVVHYSLTVKSNWRVRYGYCIFIYYKNIIFIFLVYIYIGLRLTDTPLKARGLKYKQILSPL